MGSYYEEKHGVWVIYDFRKFDGVTNTANSITVLGTMEDAAKKCAGTQRFTFWLMGETLPNSIKWFADERPRDEILIPKDWHIMKCGCLAYGRTLRRPCADHKGLWSDGHYSIAKEKDGELRR